MAAAHSLAEVTRERDLRGATRDQRNQAECVSPFPKSARIPLPFVDKYFIEFDAKYAPSIPLLPLRRRWKKQVLFEEGRGKKGIRSLKIRAHDLSRFNELYPPINSLQPIRRGDRRNAAKDRIYSLPVYFRSINPSSWEPDRFSIVKHPLFLSSPSIESSFFHLTP